jgi:DNA mismatch repair ATPase MutS
VRTLISRGDDLARGQSYFGVELELTRDLVHAAADDNPHLFVIDEIFRGTNTVERVAAARAVLQRLASKDHIVLAATHDLELLPLLGNAWDFHHFRESIDDGRLSFDYRLRPGPTSTHNAIRLMELYGFPQDVVAEARRTVDRIESAMGRSRHSASSDAGAGDA